MKLLVKSDWLNKDVVDTTNPFALFVATNTAIYTKTLTDTHVKTV